MPRPQGWTIIPAKQWRCCCCCCCLKLVFPADLPVGSGCRSFFADLLDGSCLARSYVRSQARPSPSLKRPWQQNVASGAMPFRAARIAFEELSLAPDHDWVACFLMSPKLYSAVGLNSARVFDVMSQLKKFTSCRLHRSDKVFNSW
ncbi:unnamed protein product [Polarella glacialis]|uniref:Uncharacterized protein n=1 Tax=Polarella glacialis TaxID=89957 RepID=A0A813JQ34_POLGL|nr:unnamed protein product [Polarella glacialis]CAE8682893.1 unnamed protein product [Polarella glacialis]